MRSLASQNCVKRLAQVAALVAGARGFGQGFFLLQRHVKIVADAVELRGPGGERVRLAGIEHVAHGQADGVQIVLDAQQLQRVFAVAVDHFALQLADARKLQGDVAGIRQHGENGDDQAQIQPARRSTLCRGNFLHAKRI